MEDNDKQNCQNCIKQSNLEYEHFKSSVEDNGRYDSIMGSIFFVSILTVFCFLSNNFNETQKILFSKWYIISLSAFIVNELINMLRSYFEYRIKISQWNDYLNKKIDFDCLKRNINISMNKIYYKNTLIWFVLFILSLYAGIRSILILFDVAFKNNIYSIVIKGCYMSLMQIILSFLDLFKSTPFIVLLLALIFKKPIIKVLLKIDFIKWSKEGLELRKTTQEAKNILEDLKELTCTMYTPVLKLMYRTGRLNMAMSIPERLECRDSMLHFIEKNNIKDANVDREIKQINDFIVFDILTKIKYSIKDNKIQNQIRQLIQDDNGTINPKIDDIKKIVAENGAMDEDNEYLFKEAEYFISNKTFKDLDKLMETMGKK